jgi:6-phosphogluconolactonase (cycloisomerase 2 family)
MSIRRTTPRILNIVFAAAALVCVSALAGCASFFTPVNGTTTGSNNGTGDFVYFGKNNSSTLAGYQIGTGGSLTPITGTAPTLVSPPTALVISPNNQFLYVGTSTNIYAYSISTTGILTPLNSGQSLSAFPVAAMDISPDGNWLVVVPTSQAASSTSTGLLFPLSSVTGLFTSTGVGFQVPATGLGQSVQFAPNEATSPTSVFVASYGTGGIATYTFSTNTTVGVGGVPSLPISLPVSTVANASDNQVIWNSTATQIYFVSGGGDQTLYTYNVSSTTGAITGAPGGGPAGSIATGTNPTALTFDNSGTFVYVTDQGAANAANISGYTATTSGSATNFAVLGTSPFSTSGTGPDAILNAGPYVMAVNQVGQPDLVLYSVDSTSAGRLFVSSSETTTLISTPSTSPSVVIAATD